MRRVFSPGVAESYTAARDSRLDLKLVATVFVTIFVAEIADKSQIVTLLYASNAQYNKLSVYIGSSLALMLASGVAVFAGVVFSNWFDAGLMARVAGIAFILVGIWTFVRA